MFAACVPVWEVECEFSACHVFITVLFKIKEHVLMLEE
jgi:hypothetical protein